MDGGTTDLNIIESPDLNFLDDGPEDAILMRIGWFVAEGSSGGDEVVDLTEFTAQDSYIR